MTTVKTVRGIVRTAIPAPLLVGVELNPGPIYSKYILVKQDEQSDATESKDVAHLDFKEIETDLPEKRFASFHALVAINNNHDIGDTEPPAIRAVRPFLLTSEATSSGRGVSGKGGKKNKGKDICKAYTTSERCPGLMNFVSQNKEFKMTAEVPSSTFLTSSTTVEVKVGGYFILNNLNDITSLGNVFDQYRIDEIEAWLEPTVQVDGTALGQLLSNVDYDDAAAPGSVAAHAEASNIITTNGLTSHYHRWKPHCAIATYAGAFTSYANVVSPWIDFASPSVEHYGLKASTSVAGTAHVYTLRYRYHFTVKNVR